jgi:hypothetical protein
MNAKTRTRLMTAALVTLLAVVVIAAARGG